MRAVFLDRDGVINEIVYFPELGLLDSPLNPKQFKLLPNAARGIKLLNSLGLKVIIASNQPAIAKGKTTRELFEKIREKMIRELKKSGARIDAEYYCFHHPAAKYAEYRVKCRCRKPKPGLLLKAAKERGIDLSKSFLVGDSVTDIAAGKAAGCKTILIGYLKSDLSRLIEEKNTKPNHIAPSLLEAAKIIKKELQDSKK